MKVKTLTRAMTLNESVVKSIKIYFGMFSETNIILNIKDTNDIPVSEKRLLVFIEDNEQVNSFLYEDETLVISIR